MKETRNYGDVKPIQENSRTVEGYAIVWNKESRDLGGFTEIIEPSAIDGVLEKSDVLCLLNHNEDRGVLARYNKGVGTLDLSVDETGLKYRFEAPNTALGDELLEGLKRGDISTSSFAFTIESEEWEKKEAGEYLRRITKFSEIFDVSPVYKEAYPDTSVACRAIDQLNKEDIKELESPTEDDSKKKEELKNYFKLIRTKMKRNSLELIDEKEQLSKKIDELIDLAESEERELTDKEESLIEEIKEQIEVIEEELEEKKLRKVKKSTKEPKTTMRKFSLLKAINDVANNRQLDERAQEVVNNGKAEFRKVGKQTEGQIILPVEERAVIQATVATAGQENVAEDKLNILEPLRANLVMVQAGASYLTGLSGDVSIPVYSGANVGWEDEIDDAMDGAGKFSEVTLSPKRLTAFVDISKQFLAQDSNDAEEILKRDIVNAISNKLEATILSDSKGSSKQPAGLFNGVTAETSALSYEDIVDMETELEDANVVGNKTFIVSPKAKSILRTTKKNENSFLMENGEVEGYKVLTSSAVTSKGIVFGNFEDYVIAQWGGIDLTVDPYTQASKGKIRLVVNAYFDAKPRRSEAFAKTILA